VAGRFKTTWENDIKYASEVISLLAAHPGRPFKMVHIRRYVESTLLGIDTQRRQAIRIGVARVIDELVKSGTVIYARSPKRYGTYQWRDIASNPDCYTQSYQTATHPATITPAKLRPEFSDE
jgi:hypothetical protein